MSYNLDRKDPAVGYQKDNCVVCCALCNRAKGDNFSYEEFLLIGPLVALIKDRRKSGS